MTIPVALQDDSPTESNRKNMLEPAAIREMRPVLTGKVSCSHCGSAMNEEAGKFSCPNSAAGNCPEVSADARDLLARVIVQVVDRVVTGDRVERVSERMKERLEPAALEQRSRLSATERDISVLREAKLRILQEVEEGTRPYQDAAEEVNEIDRAAAGLAYQSMVARDELDKIDFMQDEEGIRGTAQDIRTYVESPAPEYVQRLLDLVVKEVRVGPGEALLVYALPVPDGENPQGIESDRIPLG